MNKRVKTTSPREAVKFANKSIVAQWLELIILFNGREEAPNLHERQKKRQNNEDLQKEAWQKLYKVKIFNGDSFLLTN